MKTLLLALSILVAGCQSQHIQKPHAVPVIGTFVQDCSPWDGPALHMMLPLSEGQHYPQIQLTVWEETFPSFLHFPAADKTGHMSYCESDKDCDPITEAIVNTSAEKSGNVLHGTIKATLKNGTVLDHNFEAVFDKSVIPLCG